MNEKKCCMYRIVAEIVFCPEIVFVLSTVDVYELCVCMSRFVNVLGYFQLFRYDSFPFGCCSDTHNHISHIYFQHFGFLFYVHTSFTPYDALHAYICTTREYCSVSYLSRNTIYNLVFYFHTNRSRTLNARLI